MLTLLKSIQQLNIPVLQELIQNGAEVNSPCSNDQLPLEIAVTQLFQHVVGNFDFEKGMQVIDLLLAAGVEPHKVYIGEESLLHYLCKQGTRNKRSGFWDDNENEIKNDLNVDETLKKHLELALSLIQKLFAGEQKLDINGHNKQGNTPLLIAFNRKNFDLAKLLISLNADITIPDGDDITTLHLAVKSDCFLELLPNLIKKLSIDIQTKHGHMPLDYAKAPNTILFLLQNGAHAKEHDLLSLFSIAHKQQHTALIDYLIAQGLATYTAPNKMSALQWAKDEALIEKLLRNGALTKLTGEEFHCLFINWFLYGNLDDIHVQRRLALLEEYKADFHAKDSQGNTLLHQADDKKLKIIQFLLITSIDVNAQNNAKQTALHSVAAIFQFEAMKLLVAHPADPMLVDDAGLTPLEKIDYRMVIHRNDAPEEVEKLLMQLLTFHPLTKLPHNIHDLLLTAVHCNALSLLQALHLRGAILSTRSPKNPTSAYELVARDDRIPMIRWMLSTLEGNPQRPEVLSAMLVASTQHFQHETVALLLESGGNINTTTGDGSSLLSYFMHFLDIHLNEYTDPEQQAVAAGKTFTLLLDSGININQKNTNNQTFLQELLDKWNRPHNWPLMKTLLQHEAELPDTMMHLSGLAYSAAVHEDRDTLSYIVKNCSEENKGRLILYLAQHALGRADSVLLEQLIGLGLKLDATLPGYAKQNRRICLMDIALSEIKHLQSGAGPDDSTTRNTNQQKMLLLLIKHKIALHYPTSHGEVSILHIAAARGWVEILMILLQPNGGFHVDQRASNVERETALQIAVQKKQHGAVQLLLQLGANVRIVTREGKGLLHLACENGDIDMVSLLLQTKKININARYDIFFKPVLAIHTAVFYIDKNIAHKLVALLINHQAEVDGRLLQALIADHAPIALLDLALDKVFINMMLENRLLHYAVRSKNLAACQTLLKRCPKSLEITDVDGCSPLHHATAPHNQTIFDLFLKSGANASACNYEGYDVNTYAFCYQILAPAISSLPETHEDKEEAKVDGVKSILPTMNEIKKLYVKLIEQKEFASSDEDKLFTLARYCYKLILLFDTAAIALQYIHKYQNANNYQPIHDLCLFQLPVVHAHWQRQAWSTLVLEHGTQVTPYLHWAARIEAILKKAPTSLDELKKAVEKISYARELEKPELAKLLVAHKVPDAAFNRVLDNYKEQTTNHLPNIFIDGKEIVQPKYYLKKLPINDLRGFVLGSFTRCCQSVGSGGETCAMHGMSSPYGGFYVVFKRAEPSEITKAKVLYEKAAKAQSIQEFIEQFSNKSQKQKYHLICREIKTGFIEQKTEQAEQCFILNKLRERLKAEWQNLQEGTLIAQSWAWLSEHGALVLDSWEMAQDGYEKLCLPFLEKLADVAITRYGFKRVLLGKEGQTPQNLKLRLIQEVEYPRDYYGYRDSREQYILKTVEEVATLSFAAVTKVGFFNIKTTSSNNESYLPTQIDEILLAIPHQQKQIMILPAIELITCGTKAIAEKFQSMLVNEISDTTTYILPMLTKENFWTVCVIATGVMDKERWHTITYLDFTGNTVPQELTYILQQAKLSAHTISRLTTIYNESSADSGIWLVVTLRCFIETGVLAIPVQEIVHKRGALVSDILSKASLNLAVELNPHDLVLEYSGLPSSKLR